MSRKRRWVVDVDIDELREEGCTFAVAKLHHDGVSLEGAGIAHRRPHDAELARVGDDLAAARALVELAGRLQADAEQALTELDTRMRRTQPA